MHLKHFLYLSGVQAALSQSLTDVLTSRNGTLSTLISLLQQQPQLVSALGNLQDITILAPSNDAFRTLLADPAVASKVQADPGFVPALLTYHVLNGTFYSSDLAGAFEPVFAPTLLTDPSFSTVSGGQRVEARSEDGSVVIYTGNQAQAKVQATVKFIPSYHPTTQLLNISHHLGLKLHKRRHPHHRPRPHHP